MPVSDPFRQGLERGWLTQDGSRLEHDLALQADIAVIGSGAGGATSAQMLSAAGFKVLLIEEGPLKTSSDFHLLEHEAYASLYQEGLGRMSKDGAITILQGRAVGGTTLVNWTSSFRTPPPTLEHWASAHAVHGLGEADLRPWFERVEQELGISPWALPPNANNEVLRRGCEQLGYRWAVIPRNVRGCWNLGYCGMGCPVNAKQSMLVTRIPATLDHGGELLYLARAERLEHDGERVRQLHCQALDAQGIHPTGRRITVQARHYIVAAGGINSPALLLRSKAPDPHGRLGKRTFLHLVNFSAARFSERIDPYYGAPQSIYSDHFQWQGGSDGPVGYKLEVPPLHPALASTLLGSHGAENARRMAELPHTHVMLALLRDGFHPQSQGGNVELRGDGSPVLDYPVTDYLRDGLRRAYHSMAQIQFAAGATQVTPVHADARPASNLAQAQQMIDALQLEPFRTRLGSAHVMGGCAMGERPQQAVCDSLGRHHQLANLSVHDGSLFPTSIGANPQLSVYAISARLTEALIGRLARSA
ncbi:GMC family oxidoreductase [Pantoea sp. Ap-967]|uniref:GMC family oxidoreductase n=1 Tax=Pantoea sp. Ap-967 TaxID=2608362 RepID=UPI00141EEEF8|nr:GMC family oxidoreductase [Pantoea sp. Ap-967]NIE76115.1 GMC family oxidoreductase [Pantoea sp. Ap-967]